jgi:hypothetical protein
MVPVEKLKGTFQFGPFKTSHHRAIVDSKFRSEFFNYLEHSILPQVEGEINRVDGCLWSDYDEEIFTGPQSIAKRKYSFKIRFFSGREKQTASGEIEFFEEKGAFEPSRRHPPSVDTLSAKKKRRDHDKNMELILKQYRAGQQNLPCPFCGSKISITASGEKIREIRCAKCLLLAHIDYFGPL